MATHPSLACAVLSNTQSCLFSYNADQIVGTKTFIFVPPVGTRSSSMLVVFGNQFPESGMQFGDAAFNNGALVLCIDPTLATLTRPTVSRLYCQVHHGSMSQQVPKSRLVHAQWVFVLPWSQWCGLLHFTLVSHSLPHNRTSLPRCRRVCPLTTKLLLGTQCWHRGAPCPLGHHRGQLDLV